MSLINPIALSEVLEEAVAWITEAQGWMNRAAHVDVATVTDEFTQEAAALGDRGLALRKDIDVKCPNLLVSLLAEDDAEKILKLLKTQLDTVPSARRPAQFAALVQECVRALRGPDAASSTDVWVRGKALAAILLSQILPRVCDDVAVVASKLAEDLESGTT